LLTLHHLIIIKLIKQRLIEPFYLHKPMWHVFPAVTLTHPAQQPLQRTVKGEKKYWILYYKYSDTPLL